MASEQFSLCWDNFHKNMSSGMQSLLENEDLVDVTLAVEGKYLKAHKMVLSVCSPYFRELFQSNPCKHPIVFMKDVSFIALNDLLQFMYQGEVQVAQENLSTFIKTAEALQIKGLTGDGNNQNEGESSTETEVEKPVVESVKRLHESTSTQHIKTGGTARRRLSGPASKRPKFSMSANEHVTQSANTTSALKSESSNNTVHTTDEVVHFKMEPHESAEHFQTQEVDETPADDSALDDGADDGEDYSFAETGDEVKAGTSTEGMPEGQDTEIKSFGVRQKRRTRYIYDGFSYHTSVLRTNPPIRYLICAKYTSTGCHARAVLPLNAPVDQLRVTRNHNHPPDETAEEKFLFFKQLKEVTRNQLDTPLRVLFDGVISLYPRISNEMHFTSIRTSMRRWRREAKEENTN